MIGQLGGDFEVVPSVPTRFAEIVVDAYEKRTEERFSIALSGGSSAEPCYEQLNTLSKGRIDWSNVDVFWSDERCVPLEDERSNAGNVKRLFLDALDPAPKMFPMNCDEGADAYEFLLRTKHLLDIVHLGIGPDGHTASLFPNSPALQEKDRLVLLNEDPSGNNPLTRMTFTFPGISKSQHVVVTAFGSKKADIIKRIADSDDVPAAHIHAQRVTWLLDPESARLL